MVKFVNISMLIFKPSTGASGDMILASLLHLGGKKTLDDINSSLKPLTGASITLERIEQYHLAGARLTINCTSEKKYQPSELSALISASPLGKTAKKMAGEMLSRLVAAECAVHNTTEPVFHQLAGVDTLISIAGTCKALESLGAFDGEIYTMPITVGAIRNAALHIFQKSRHPLNLIDCDHELCTPTGAAILSTIAKQVSSVEGIKVLSSGIGFGTEDVCPPNALQVIKAAKNKVNPMRLKS
ncbi:hypothetical protein COT30_03235 [Candidatus Micrarchaeota archaeon CG08_land_8_20_14_0_20_49_17]|nr:MAG: hypothetical protein AUJ13_05825 [Candidatus Micrarchaeota archaeon CG1_02_49_24]PIU09668.1 MAG: hypothetical protein COT30_03235 [Candidatus Micrarchaeota archaeon CG08_land_8_20_14_0_20_49_17]PIU82274.1 MAG: hypothetical protein COS70_01875 [Candidatus Micrarchaeota archaeon CG06_land_8_20_14_3_00_50_6]PIZ92223.1 MAG: hypothetical protein COX84_07130 [Candidatus Micrarchaeota archaeon CG_4_10_14_0_2_um_filter_49_7]